MLRVLEILRFLFTPSPRTAFQGPFIRSGSGRAARWILERQSPKVKQVQDDEVGDCLPSLSASSAPLPEAILHAEAQRTQSKKANQVADIPKANFKHHHAD